MKSFKNFFEASFSPKNFPSGVGNNDDFSGAGERTTYAPVDLNNYKFKEGFPMSKNSSLYSADGKVVKSLKKGDTIYFTVPATLHRASEFNIKPARSTVAPVSLKGFDQPVDGYVAIGSVEKPAGNNQGRVGAGSKTQDAVAFKVKDIAFSKGIEVESEFKTARPGSTRPDLEMTIAGNNVQFEIKGTANRRAAIAFYDKSIRRSGKKPKVLEDVADVYRQTLKVKEGDVSTLMSREKFPPTFIGLIDFFNSRDSKIGLAGDKGVVKSGRLPSEFAVTDRATLTKMRDEILDHFKEGGDDYFVIHNRSDDSYEIYYVGGGTSSNVLDMPELPAFKSFALTTYGGASSGATRVGFKIKL